MYPPRASRPRARWPALRGMVTARRRREHDDLTWALLQAEIDGDRLSDDEVIAFLFPLVVAGNETTTKLLGNAWYWGWRNPDQLAKPLADPSWVSDWVEETLRYDNSTQMLVRVTVRPVRVQGVDIEEGRRVLLLIGSANRDGAVFEAPDRYDLDRATQDLVSFGSGRHFCMGAPLARMEARVALARADSGGFLRDRPDRDRAGALDQRAGFGPCPPRLPCADGRSAPHPDHRPPPSRARPRASAPRRHACWPGPVTRSCSAPGGSRSANRSPRRSVPREARRPPSVSTWPTPRRSPPSLLARRRPSGRSRSSCPTPCVSSWVPL